MLKSIVLVPLVLFAGCADLDGTPDLDDTEGPDYIDETTPSGKADAEGGGSVSDYCHKAAVTAVGKLEKANYEKVRITGVAFKEPGLFNGDFLTVAVKRASGSKWIDDSWVVHFSDSGDEEGGCEIFGVRNVRVPALEQASRVDRKITPGCKFAVTKAAQRLEALNGWGGKTGAVMAIDGGTKKYPVLDIRMNRNLATEAFPDADELFASSYIASSQPSGSSSCRIWAIQDVDSIFGPGVLDGGDGEDGDGEDGDGGAQ